VPLRLTAVAAQPDMSIRTFILADHRAVPQNYFHVRINEARIDWFGSGSNYKDLVSEAVDAAPGGQGFVTEYAGPSAVMKDQLWSAGRFDLSGLRTRTDPVDYFDQLLGAGFRGSRQLLSIFRQYLPEPANLVQQGVDERSFYNCLSCYRQDLAGVAFDPARMTDAIEEEIVRPLQEAQQLIDSHPYLTTLYSTMSPEEMLSDPTFTYNPDVPDVSNVHRAVAHVQCGMGGEYMTSPVRLELPGGEAIGYGAGLQGVYQNYDYAAGRSGGVLGANQAGPAARIVEMLGESGGGQVLQDNMATIQMKLAAFSGDEGSGCGGCSTGGNAAWASVALALVALRRRRRAG
jgi:MYXO-CTERM domain-containing protein